MINIKLATIKKKYRGVNMKLRIEWTYGKSKNDEVLFYADELEMIQALAVAEDLQKTGRTKRLTLIDRFDTHWTMKEIRQYIKELETEPHNIIIYFDGGFDHETKTAGLACVIYYEQNGKSYRMRRNAQVEELKSNNEAEYAALHLCMEELENLKVHHLPVKIMGDSRVVINHLTEEWPAIEKSLSEWADKIEEKLKKLNLRPDYYLIGRNANKEADRLATQALQGVEILATSEVE